MRGSVMYSETVTFPESDHTHSSEVFFLNPRNWGSDSLGSGILHLPRSRNRVDRASSLTTPLSLFIMSQVLCVCVLSQTPFALSSLFCFLLISLSTFCWIWTLENRFCTLDSATGLIASNLVRSSGHLPIQVQPQCEHRQDVYLLLPFFWNAIFVSKMWKWMKCMSQGEKIHIGVLLLL